MRSIAGRTVLIASALPAALLARVPGFRTDMATRLGDWAALAPRVALVVTAPFWLLIIVRGVLYPAVGADNLEQSWGGPTLVGAWMTHLAVGIAALALVSVLLAVGTRRSAGP